MLVSSGERQLAEKQPLPSWGHQHGRQARHLMGQEKLEERAGRVPATLLGTASVPWSHVGFVGAAIMGRGKVSASIWANPLPSLRILELKLRKASKGQWNILELYL